MHGIHPVVDEPPRRVALKEGVNDGMRTRTGCGTTGASQRRGAVALPSAHLRVLRAGGKGGSYTPGKSPGRAARSPARVLQAACGVASGDGRAEVAGTYV